MTSKTLIVTLNFFSFRWDFLFLDGDDDDDDDDDVLYHSYYTDEADLTDNDEDFSLWN